MSDLDFQTLRQVLSYRLHGVLTCHPITSDRPHSVSVVMSASPAHAAHCPSTSPGGSFPDGEGCVTRAEVAGA